MSYRREVLAQILGAPFAARVLGACGDREQDRTAAHVEGELLGPSMDHGHRLRDGELPSEEAWARAPSRRVGVAILGGGPSGLSAAWRLARAGVEDFEVLELEREPGGTSVSGRSEVTRYPWGAHYLPLPMAHHTELIALLREMGAVTGIDDRGMPIGAEELLVREPKERLFLEGFWYEGLYPHAGASADDLRELARFQSEIDRLVGLRDAHGRRAFAIPVAAAFDHPEARALDAMTAAEWLTREGFRSQRLRWLVEYGCRDDYGLGLESASAWAALWYYAARTPEPGAETMDLLAWPEGNGALVRHLSGAAHGKIRTGQLVVEAVPVDGAVEVRVIDADRGPSTVVADRVIVAMPRFIARRVVRPLRARGDEGFEYGSWIVANVHLASRPASNGYPLAWDNVLYDSRSLGYVCATHQRGRDFGPTVLTYYLPLVDADPAAARWRLVEPSWEDWRDAVMLDLGRAHLDLRAHVRRVDVWRWGHAMIQPRVGFLSSSERRRAAEPIDRIHFAHSDLSAVAIFEEAFSHGVRAADEVLRARGAPA